MKVDCNSSDDCKAKLRNIRRFGPFEPKIASPELIDPTAVIIGQVELGVEANLWPYVVARGDIHSIYIGERTNIQDGSVLHVSHRSDFMPQGAPLRIGDEVTVGHNAVLHGCQIGNRCLIGMGAVVMDHAEVPDEVVIAAGALVPGGKVLESGFLYVGSPVQKKRPLTEKERQYFGYSAQHYVRLAKAHYAGGAY